MQKNVASQKWVVFAFDLTDNTAKTGDAANITAKISKDGAAGNATNDTNPTELEDGYYVFDLTQAETNADMCLIMPESSTSDIQVVGVPAVVFTTPANFPDLGIESDGDLTKVNTLDGHTPQTGDSFARIGAAGASLTSLGGMSSGMKAEVNAECDTALSDYDPPTKAEMDSGFAGLNDVSSADVTSACETAISNSEPIEANVTQIDGNATNGNNATLKLASLDIRNPSGHAIYAASTGGNGAGMKLQGQGSGDGLESIGGATGNGIEAMGGSTSGNGLHAEADTEGEGIRAIAGGMTRHGIRADGAGGGDGMQLNGDTSGKDISADEIDDILEDTGTTIPATLTTIDGKVDTVDTNVDAVLVDTGTTLPATMSTIEGKVDTVDGIVDDILTDTADMQPKFGTIPDLGSGSTIGDNATDIYNASGGSTPADIADAVWDEALSGHTGAGSAGKALADIETGVDNLETQIGTAGDGLTSLPEVDADLKKINGDSVVGNAATLTLKQLDIQNTDGHAIIAETSNSGSDGIHASGAGLGAGIHAIGVNNAGIHAESTGAGHGIYAHADDASSTGHGIYAVGSGGSSSDGCGINAYAPQEGHGIEASGGLGSGHGIYAEGGTVAGNGIQADGGTNGTGLKAQGNGTGDGAYIGGGVVGHGLKLEASGIDKSGLRVDTVSGAAIKAISTSAGGVHIEADADAVNLVAGSNGLDYVGGGGDAIRAMGNGDGSGLKATGGTSGYGARLTGDGSASGLLAQGGSSNGDGISTSGAGAGHGIHATGGASDGHGICAEGDGVGSGIYGQGSTDGAGVLAVGGNSGNGVYALGYSSEAAILAKQFGTGAGIEALGGSTSGDGIKAESQTSGNGINAIGGSTSGHGIEATGTLNADGIKATGNGTGHGVHGVGGNANGAGIRGVGDYGILANASTYQGIKVTGFGGNAGIQVDGGSTGAGLYLKGGATSGDGLKTEAQTDGKGINAIGAGANAGLNAQGGSTGHGILAASGGSGGDGMRLSSAIAAGLTASGGMGQRDIAADEIGVPTNLDDDGASLAGNAKDIYEALGSTTNGVVDDIKDILLNKEVKTRHANQKPSQYEAGTGANLETVDTTIDVNGNVETEVQQ